MTPMPRKPAIPYQTLQRAQRLLATGVPPMVVSKQLRLSRHAVSKIEELILRLRISESLVRCPECGAMVQAPCRQCSISAEVLG